MNEETRHIDTLTINAFPPRREWIEAGLRFGFGFAVGASFSFALIIAVGGLLLKAFQSLT